MPEEGCYHDAMGNGDLQRLRDRLIAHLASHRHGELKRLAERVGISRQHLAAFRDGGAIGDDLAGRLSGELAPAASDPLAVIVAELQNILMVLESPAFDQDFKVERFFQRINEIHGSEKAIRAALGKTKERKR